MSKIFIDKLKELYPEIEFGMAQSVYVDSITRLYHKAGVAPPTEGGQFTTVPIINLLVVRGLMNLAHKEEMEEVEKWELAEEMVRHDLGYDDGDDECIMCSG